MDGSSKAKRLSSLCILGIDVKIDYCDLMEDWGTCDIDEKKITLSTRCLKDKKQHSLTVIHEVTHMIFEMTGLAYMEKNDEEAYVRCVENLLVPWIFKNKDTLDV
jgi:hypothetical protein